MGMHADCGHGMIMAMSMAQLRMQVMTWFGGCKCDAVANVMRTAFQPNTCCNVASNI